MSIQTQPCLIMGILNVTPDSFSDGGDFFSLKNALERCIQLAEDGADVIDIGAESTRPGAKPLDVEDEWQRLEPILMRLSQANLQAQISVDTYKPEIMLRSLEYGVSMINNVQGLVSSEHLRRLAQVKGLRHVCMHMHKEPQSMQVRPLKGQEAVAAVDEFFAVAHKSLRDAGFHADDIYLDPGIGFGKDLQANILLLAKSAEYARQYNLCIGLSRKSFLAKLGPVAEPKDRDAASKILEMNQILLGAKMIRTHAVKPLRMLMRSLA